ncbi:MAG: winged helix-turn-helix domain-containing protein [Candidatus Bathyarchaeota archaeon]|nr:winged helix-turn-helix domain-containing protein [Candidatus Bathyarchaeota archaeon]
MRRGKVELVVAVLDAVKRLSVNGGVARASRVGGLAGLNYGCVKRFLGLLVERGFVVKELGGFRLTERGVEFIFDFKRFREAVYELEAV